MLEDQVAYLLQRYLGNYVLGLNREALKISVWKGDVELTNMQLKPEALNSLKLPVKVKAGFLGSVKLKVPWSRLGQEPVLVYLDHIFILAEPATQVEDSSEDAVQEAKKSRVKEMETKLLESLNQQKSEMNASWLGSLINTIIGNLKLSITNVHIRYEDLESNPGHPFAFGATLRKLSAVTVDDFGKETFATGGALEQIQKSVELERLSLYFDSDIHPWNVEKPWRDLIPSEWIQIFEPQKKNAKSSKKNPEEHSYLLQPVTGNARYIKLPSNESRKPGQPLQKAIVNLDDVTLCLSKEGYRDTLMLADNFSFFNQRLKYAHYRPQTPIKLDPVSWWKYAYRVVVDELKKASGKFSWEQVWKHTILRKKYVTLYASLLNSDSGQSVIINNREIDNLDRELDTEVIIQWRMLAHRFVKQFTKSDVYLKKQNAKSSWWPFGWSGSSKDEDEPRAFTEMDWEKINKIIGYKEDSDDKLPTSYDKEDNMFLFLFEIHMKHNASKIITDDQTCLADLSCDELDFSIKMYSESKIFDFKLGTYRLLSPNGLLAESATASDSLIGLFSYKPFASQLDWSFVAKASPCYMTYLKESIDQIISFFKSSTSISQTLALETAAAVQTTLDEVRRNAHNQVTRALKDDLRFSLDLDIAAPKITIPTKFYPDNVNGTSLLLNLGNLMLSTQDYWEVDSFDEKDQYLQFHVILSDVSAFLVDGSYSWGQTSFESSCSLFPVIDRCGISMKLQQIQSESSHYPSSRLSIGLPSLCFYFSPARYHRLMQVVKIFSEEDNTSSDMESPWSQADIEGWVSLLSWKGVGNREAFWQRRYFSLVGPFLYILECPTSKAYKDYISLRGKQINQVPTELTGNVDHVLVVSDTGQLNAKVVEDASNLIFRLNDDDSCKTWQIRLQAAVYRVSGSSAITSLSEISSTTDVTKSEISGGSSVSNILNVEKLFITGTLDELKICFSCNYQNNQSLNAILLGKESPLFDFRAIGGQVELSLRGNDLFIGTLLRSLEVEDKFQCESTSMLRYLARSFIKSSEDSSTTSFSSVSTGKQNDSKSKQIRNLNEDQFFEASESFSELTGSQSSLSVVKMSVKPPSFRHVRGLIPDAELQKENIDSETTDTLDSFIIAQVVFYHQDSSLYTNIDKRVSVTLATLSFFCHRPTILAILEFVNAINILDGHDENIDKSSIAERSTPRNIVDTSVSENAEELVARGLLGKGKSRIIFYSTLNMFQAQIFLVNEDGASIVTLSQNNLLTDIKVFPSSFSIKASLGNLKISDDSLSSSHSYYWVCDMRNPGGSSFVELDFSSYNPDEDDYYGCDYSLTGQLSEVRVVYLNRFVQEIASYFVGLVPSDSKGLVKLKDQVSNSEVWLTTNEIDGSSALSLDLSLTKPIIIMPRRTDSTDYMEVDVHHITVRNTFQWLHGDKSQMSAVHLETMTIQVKGFNLTIYTEDISGENIIDDVKGLSFVIQRSLRDLLHQIPALEIFVKIEELRCSLCSHEYQIITECALSNTTETPNIVPALDLGFGNSSNVLNETSASASSYVVELESQEKEAWITLKISVSINLIALQLHSGATRETSLATIQASGVWLLYKSDSSGEGFLWSTLQGFTVTDEREGTKPEFRHAIGKHENIGHFLHSYGDACNVSFSDPAIKGGAGEYDFGAVLTMLILDVTFRKSMTSISLCVQRPDLLVALDFLLAITEFFVPTVRMLFSEGGDGDLLLEYDEIVLDLPIYNQPLTEFSLSPNKPLIVDHESFDHYVYDGKGGSLILMDSQGKKLSTYSTETVIFIGSGKRLQFKNVHIKNGEFLDSCISLGSNSSYSVSELDSVYLGRGGKDVLHSEENITTTVSQKHTAEKPSEMEYNIELQAIGPELTFYTTSKDIGESLLLSNKLLHTKLDVFCRLILKGKTTEITGKILGLQMECNGIMVLEPFDTFVKFSNIDGRTIIRISISGILMNLSFSILRLFLAVEEDILAFVRMTSKKVSVSCSQFDKVGTLQCGEQTYAFWRPRAPSGFAVLGDCLTPLNEPPSKGVLAVNINFVKVKRPMSYKLIWPPLASEGASGYHDGNLRQDASTSSPVKSDAENLGCSIWFPLAPHGYVSMGCVVSVGRREPPSSSCLCILASLVSPCSLKDCISLSLCEPYTLNFAFWRVKNSFGTFLPADPHKMGFYGKAYELRQLSLQKLNQSADTSVGSNLNTNSLNIDETDQLQRQSLLSSGRLFEAVTDFRLIWWNQSFPRQKKLSIWRPAIPHGMVYFGDIAVQGYEPPNSCYVLRDSGDDSLLKTPIDFQVVGKLKYKNENIRFWLPQAPPGYVSLGCIASKNPPKHGYFSSLRCIRSDMVIGDQFSNESIWNTIDTNLTKDLFSIWSVGNNARTFVIRKGLKKPPKRFALKLVDPNVSSNSSDTVIDAKVNVLSAAVYDDYGGLMVPLFNISFSGIDFTWHGRPGYMNSTVVLSLTGRSYNDKYDSWEPVIEPADIFLRYQYDLNAPGAVSQLRITSTKDLNVNISSSNVNMILQAYSSWINFSITDESYRNREMVPLSYSGRSIIDVHNKTNHYILPQNKLGQDIFIRPTEMKRYSTIIKMPSGDNKPVKFPVSKNTSDSHLEWTPSGFSRSLLSVIISRAEFIAPKGLSTGHYFASVRIFSNSNQVNESISLNQFARTCGAVSKQSSTSNLLSVNWNEMFFFKVDLTDDYTLELILVDMGTGEPLGLYNAKLQSCDFNPESFWIELQSGKFMVPEGERNIEPKGRIKCAFFLPVESQDEDYRKNSVRSTKPGFIQISPTNEGPWTTVRLNYATQAACWRLGNNVVASELTIINGARYVNIRSLVSVTNNTDYTMDLRLKSKEYHEASSMLDSRNEDIYGFIYDTDEVFEIEKYDPANGWVNNSSNAPSSSVPSLSGLSYTGFQGFSSFQLPDGWKIIDDWHLGKLSENNDDGWVYAPDVEHLRWPESFSDRIFVNHARQRRWVRHRKYRFSEKSHLPLGLLKPGDTIHLPLQALVHPVLSYLLQLRPNGAVGTHQYSWSAARMEHQKAEASDTREEISEMCVSALSEGEWIVCCSQVNGSLSDSDGSNFLWFCLSSKPIEIGKDIHLDPIHDWKILITSPFTVTNYLPLTSEYSVLRKNSTDQFVKCFQRTVSPGQMTKFYSVDLQDPLYLSLNIQGWEMINEPVLISHPHKLPSNALSLRSSLSRRVVPIILEQSHDNEHMMAQCVRVYAPYWIASSRCPPLTYRLMDILDRKETSWPSLSLNFSKSIEKIIWDITDEEMIDGCTIASVVNFKHLGLSLSIEGSSNEFFGPSKDLSPLGDMDGLLDIYALDSYSNFIRLFLTSKPCPFQDVPTKVISVRPFMTFTNRIGQDILLKFSINDQPKCLSSSDARVSFICHDSKDSEELQVKLQDTDWSFPVKIVEENIFTIMLKTCNGDRRFLIVEIRGYEEGSRFLIVFRLGSSNGPIRIENRLAGTKISIRQSGSNDSWIQLDSLSTTNFSWINFYGQKLLDICIHNDTKYFINNVSVEENSEHYLELDAHASILLDILEVEDIKIVRFSDIEGTIDSERSNIMLVRYKGTSSTQDKMVRDTEPLELIIELGSVGTSLIDHKPKELLFLYLERVFISYSTGYVAGKTSRFKLMIGQVQLDNQLAQSVMPVMLAPDNGAGISHPVFKTTITMRNQTIDGTQMYPYVYVRVTDKSWRLNIHEPIIWSLMDFYNNLHIDRLPNGSEMTQVDPEIRIDLIDISEIRVKLSLETAPTQRPVGVLGIWSPILSAVGNALKIPVHLRKVVHRNRHMRKSLILPSVISRIKSDLIHNPLHLIFSLDLLGMTKSTFASLSKGFAELSTDGRFLQLRSKQVLSRRITGISDGILQGTEALAQGVAFGVSGVVQKPVESARQDGVLGFAQGIGRGFLGFIVQPVSGALDFVSLTVDGISASVSRCLILVSNKATAQRIRNPRAIHANGVLNDYSEAEAVGQMILYLAEASRHLGFTHFFKEPSKYAWSDYYEDHFIIPNHRILLVTNRRVILLQCLALDRMDKRPSKIIWDVPWEELMSLELAKAGHPRPSHLIIHLKKFKKSESFVRLVKCSTEESQYEEPQAFRICFAVRKMWRAHQGHMKTLTLKVPSKQQYVHFSCDETDGSDLPQSKPMLKTRGFSLENIVPKNKIFAIHCVNFKKIWSSEDELLPHCTLCPKQVRDDGSICSIWRPICPDGYISISDSARIGAHPPTVATIYQNSEEIFAYPVGYDLVWRNCLEDYVTPVSIWNPRAPEGFVSLGCVAVDGFEEPDLGSAYCVTTRIAEETLFEEQAVWTAPDSYPWACHFYQVQSEALPFVALRKKKEEYDLMPMRISEELARQLLNSDDGSLDHYRVDHIGSSSNS